MLGLGALVATFRQSNCQCLVRDPRVQA